MYIARYNHIPFYHIAFSTLMKIRYAYSLSEKFTIIIYLVAYIKLTIIISIIIITPVVIDHKALCPV